jgi:hypothetical protein
MDIKISSRTLSRILPLATLCLALAGCAANPTGSSNSAPDRIAAASLICRDTVGLNPANAPHEQCMDSLLQNTSAPDGLPPSAASPARGTKAGCAQFGLRPDSDAFARCVADLDATVFEATHPLSG